MIMSLLKNKFVLISGQVLSLTILATALIPWPRSDFEHERNSIIAPILFAFGASSIFLILLGLIEHKRLRLALSVIYSIFFGLLAFVIRVGAGIL